MSREDLILASEFCTHHRIEIAFLHSLHNVGLIELLVEEDCYLYPAQLNLLEKLVRMHYDLDVNLEGLDVARNLLQQVDDLQQEVLRLKNKLRFYEQQNQPA